MINNIIFCKWCGEEIDPEVCHCGDLINNHTVYAGHYPVPMGCICGYVSLSDNFNLPLDKTEAL